MEVKSSPVVLNNNITKVATKQPVETPIVPSLKNEPKTLIVSKDALNVLGNSQKGKSESEVSFVENKSSGLTELNLLASQKNLSKMDSLAEKIISSDPNNKELVSQVKFLQGKTYLENRLPEKAFSHFNQVLKSNPNSEQSTLIKNSFSGIIKNGQINTTTSALNKAWSATQVAMNASSSNGITTNIAYAVGGAIVGAGISKAVGISPKAGAFFGASMGSMANRLSGALKQKEQIAQAYNTGYSNVSTTQNVINAIGIAMDVGSVVASTKYLNQSIQNKTPAIGQIKTAKTSATSGTPVSEGFRQYKESESLVGVKSGSSWENTVTKNIPAPKQLAEWKGSSKVVGADAFLDIKSNKQLQGQSIKEIVSKIPKEAQLRELTPSPTIKEGFEYAWVDKKTNMDYRVRIHGADLGVAKHNPTSTAAQGWIVRVERNPLGERTFPKSEYLTLDGTFHKASELMSFEKQKKDADLALAVLRDSKTQVLGSISTASSSASVGKVSGLPSILNQETIQATKSSTLGEMIEHFHHNTHIAVGGLNKALESAISH
jgi:hypothetical protein